METHDDPARPEQTDEGYATGADHKPDPPEEELEPNFARGIAETDPNERGRFSTSEEELPDTPEEELEPNFARGIAETDPNERGRFSTSEEEHPDTPDKEREGNFSDSDERDSSSE